MQELMRCCPRALNALDLKKKEGRENCPGVKGVFFLRV